MIAIIRPMSYLPAYLPLQLPYFMYLKAILPLVHADSDKAETHASAEAANEKLIVLRLRAITSM